jgi:myo-inositol-1(or 4)-monophosphatase
MSNRWLLESELALKSASTSADILEERRPEGIAFQTKGNPRDIVTELDIAIEKHIREILAPSKHQIVGEEETQSEFLDISIKEPVWFIDPIDGTTNFISSLPFYSTSIGLVSGFEFIVGAVAMPALKQLFFTMGEEGAFMNGISLKVASRDLKNSLIVAGFSSDQNNVEKRRREFELFGNLNDKSRGCLRLGSASINICYVAAGRLQAAYGLSNKIWDVAGAIAIAYQAGNKIYIEWAKGTAKINYVVGAPGVADEIADLINLSNLAKVSIISQSIK